MLKLNIVSKYALSIALLTGGFLGTTGAFAQVDLPKATERKPNLSLDPFERAREAVRGIPRSAPSTEPARERQPAPQQAAPIITPMDEPAAAEPAAAGVDEPAEAFSYGIAAVADYLTLVSGGKAEPLATSAYPYLLDLAAEMDTGAAGFWSNGTFMAHMMLYGGTSPGDITEDFTGLSNIDAGGETVVRLLEAWYQHTFEHGKSAVLIGLHDWNSEFYIAEYGNLFLNGSFGMGAVIGASAGPSAYPATTVGVRYFSELTENSYFQVGVYDGVADEANFFQVTLHKDEGFFAGMEVGVTEKEPGEDGYYKIAVGGWYLRSNLDGYAGTEEGEEFEDIQGNTSAVVRTICATPDQTTGECPTVPGTNGAYFLGEMAVGDDIGIFFKAGWADPWYNRYSQWFAGGITYAGLVPGRVDDVLGVAVTHSRQGDKFMNKNTDPAGQFLSYQAETTYEITYSVQINDWLVVQPDLQYIQYPGFSHFSSNATVVGIRAAAEF